MVPPHQRLEARNLALLEADDWLIIELKVAVLRRSAKIELQASTQLRLIGHIRFEEPIDPASVGLRAVHREIGAFQQGRRIIVAALQHRDADARADENLVSSDDVTSLDGRDDRLRERRGRRTGHPSKRVNNRELVSAEPRAEVVTATTFVKPAGDGLQEFVADRVSERVIDILEAIEIDEQKAELSA